MEKKRRGREESLSPTLTNIVLKQDKNSTFELEQNLELKKGFCESGAKIISCDPTPGRLLPLLPNSPFPPPKKRGWGSYIRSSQTISIINCVLQLQPELAVNE